MHRPLSYEDKATWYPRAALLVGLLALAVVYLTLLLRAPDRFGLILSFGVVALVAVVLGLRSPVLATLYLLVTTFVRLAIPSGTFPVDPFLPAFAGVVLSTFIWIRVRRGQAPTLSRIEIFMGLYVLWNLISMLAPHEYAAGSPLTPTPYSVARFVLIGIIMPLAMFLIGRLVFDKERAIHQLLWSLLAAGAYSAFVSLVQFHGPTSLVWPRYIIDSPNWEGRALGVFNQPGVNGLVLIVGFLAGVLIASHTSQPRALRLLSTIIAVTSVYAIYLTHTRAVWLCFALLLIIGAAGASGFRKGYLLSVGLVFAAVLLNWSRFTSADRSAGGVASPGELQDRLNLIATSIWAIKREPLTGWGLGRFPAVNTFHHQAWSPEIPWERGYGTSSHLDLLGILTELGIIGFGLWITVLILVGTELVRAIRRLPTHGLSNRPFAITATMAFVALLVTGLAVDLRFYDFANIVVWLLVGASIGRARNAEHLQATTLFDARTPQPQALSGQVPQ